MGAKGVAPVAGATRFKHARFHVARFHMEARNMEAQMLESWGDTGLLHFTEDSMTQLMETMDLYSGPLKSLWVISVPRPESGTTLRVRDVVLCVTYSNYMPSSQQLIRS